MKLHQLIKSMHSDGIVVQAIFHNQSVKFKINDISGYLMWDYFGSWSNCNLIYNRLNKLDFKRVH